MDSQNAMPASQQSISIELSPQEAQHLYELLEIAVGAGKIQAARAAIPLVDKLVEGIRKNEIFNGSKQAGN